MRPTVPWVHVDIRLPETQRGGLGTYTLELSHVVEVQQNGHIKRAKMEREGHDTLWWEDGKDDEQLFRVTHWRDVYEPATPKDL